MASNNSDDSDYWLYKDLNIGVIERNKLTAELPEECRTILTIDNFKQVASYNWSDDDIHKDDYKPTIIVPGKAKVYKNAGLIKLEKKERKHKVDENRYRQKDYPLESLFRAVRLCDPRFNFEDIHFATDRNNLRKLFDFVDGSVKDSFRIDFQKIKNLVFLMRHEEKDVKVVDDCGQDFERKFTTGGLPGSFRKIITYDLAGFKMLVRFEVDCIEKNDLPEPMEKMALASSSSNKKTVEIEYTNLKCQLNSDAGEVIVNQDVLIELTTKKFYDNEKKFPKFKWNQLLFSQTNNLVIGWHKYEQLKEVKKYSFDNISEECGKKAQTISSELKKFADLLKKIKDFPKDEGVYSIIYNKGNPGVLEFFRCNAQVPNALPDDLINEIKLKI